VVSAYIHPYLKKTPSLSPCILVCFRDLDLSVLLLKLVTVEMSVYNYEWNLHSVLIPIILDIIKLSSLYISLKFFHYSLSTWTVQKVDQKSTWEVLKCSAGEAWRRSVGYWSCEKWRSQMKRKILHTIKWRKTNWICYVLHRNYLLKHVIKGRKDRSDERTRKKTLSNYWLNNRILKIERGSVRSRCMENSLWKSL